MDIEGIKEDLILFCIRLTKTITQVETLVNLNSRDQDLDDFVAALALGDIGIRSIYFDVSKNEIKEMLPTTHITKEVPEDMVKRIFDNIINIFVKAINAYDIAIKDKHLAKEIVKLATLNATKNAANAIMEEVEAMLCSKDTEQSSMELQFVQFKLWTRQQEENKSKAAAAVKAQGGPSKIWFENEKLKKSRAPW